MLQIPQNLCTDLTDEQASTVQGGLFVVIDKIQNIKAGADSNSGALGGADDTYVTINGNKVFEGKFQTGDTREVGIGREAGDVASIRLFDEDGVLRGQDDPLGGFTVSSPTSGTKIATVSGSGSVYEVYYQAFNL